MSYNQSFLPILAPGNLVLGIIPITTTLFTGAETSFVIGTGTYTIKQITPVRVSADINQNNSTAPYMALLATATEARTIYGSFDFLDQQTPYHRWALSPGATAKESRNNPLLHLLRGTAVPGIVTPTPAVVSAVNGIATISWATDLGGAPQFSFFEQNWVSLLAAVSGNVNSASINIGASSVPTVLANPTAATGAGSATGGTLAAATYYTQIVAIDIFGSKTSASPESVGVTTTGNTGSIAYTWTAVPNAVSYQVWYSTSAGTEAAFFATAATSFTLTATSGTAGTISSSNTTGTYVKSSAGKIALYVVQSNPQIVNNSISMNTVRFVKLTPNPITAGNYVWNCTVVNTDGSTAPVLITLVVR